MCRQPACSRMRYRRYMHEGTLPQGNTVNPMMSNHTAGTHQMHETVTPPATGSGQHERVLIVEDSHTIASVVKHFLEREGFEVLLAEDGLAGLETATREQPDLIVTDLNMPGMDGMRMVKALRADERTHDIAVLMLTSEEGADARNQALTGGADDYLRKPVAPGRLTEQVKTLLSRVKGSVPR